MNAFAAVRALRRRYSWMSSTSALFSQKMSDCARDKQKMSDCAHAGVKEGGRKGRETSVKGVVEENGLVLAEDERLRAGQ